jgi:hypothetical protein
MFSVMRTGKRRGLALVAALAGWLAASGALAAPSPGAGKREKSATEEPAAEATSGRQEKAAAAKPATAKPGKTAAATPKPSRPKNPPTQGLLKECLEGPLSGVEEIVFAVRTPGKNGHWYANFSYMFLWPEQPMYGERGALRGLNLRTKKVRTILEDAPGSVRDPQVHYDGRKILFSYRKGESPYYNLYEINVDGTGLRQLTDGPYDDIEPTYLPDGDIMFCSSRCNRSVNCFLTRVGTLYRCGPEGENLRMVSSNNEHDNTPWPLPDGRVLYTRWEYVDRNQMTFHHLWTVNPDGTGQAVYFGNLHPGWVMIDAKPIPKSGKVVAMFSPKHGRREHTGEVRVIDPRKGPDEQPSARRISPKGVYAYRDPYPISGNCFLVAQGQWLIVMDGQGNWEKVYDLPKEEKAAGVECHEPRPLVARRREPTVGPRGGVAQTTGRRILADVTYGRKTEGVKPGQVKRLLVLETLPMPVHFFGGMRPITSGGSFTLERVLGTIPVEPDGSAYAELPALRSLFFVALDGKGESVKRMQSFVTLQPGETTSCAGCHEERTATPPSTEQPALMALGRPPSRLKPVPGVPDVIDFPRDVQPILDRHCVECHGPEAREGGVSLSGNRGPTFSHSYYALTLRKQVADGRNEEFGNRAPRTIGTSASPLMRKIDGDHYEVEVSRAERDVIRMWIDSGAAYPGTYAAVGTGSIGENYWKEYQRPDLELASVKTAQRVVRERCGVCHKGPTRLPTSPSDGRGGPFSAHRLYDLTEPGQSLLLLAPLDREAGGQGICRERAKEASTKAPGKDGLLAGVEDPDYRKLLASVRDGKKMLDRIKRFDMPGFRPREEYVREMKIYGVLDKDLDPQAPIDVYATDRAYWRSFWWTGDGSAQSNAP